MDEVVGLRVVRGPDWSWGDQDGGEGHVGTVVEVDSVGRSVTVQWDVGNRSQHSYGEEGKNDIRVYDPAPAGMTCPNVICGGCHLYKVSGMCWKCTKCFDYYLCSACYMAGRHCHEHEFDRIIAENEGRKVRVPSRLNARRVEVRGIFPGAVIDRGHDWKWGNQDGGQGMLGKVLSVQGWKEESDRSVVQVEWNTSKRKNLYRVGHKGKVDLVCTSSGSGGHYYPDHLPILGWTQEPLHHPDIACGDSVQVELDSEVLRIVQEAHDKWTDDMAGVIGEIGVVHAVLDNGCFLIKYPRDRIFAIYKDAVAKVEILRFKVGDVVRVLDDMAKVHKLQNGHGDWVDDMALSLGQVGRVIQLLPGGVVEVVVNGTTWKYNPLCLTPAPGEKAPEMPVLSMDSKSSRHNLGLRAKLFPFFFGPDSHTIALAAIHGDIDTLRASLQKKPQEVNTVVEGRTPLHYTAALGQVSAMKVLLECNAKVDLKDYEDSTPLHLSTVGNEVVAAQLLVDAGADVNCRNGEGNTPLMIASGKGCYLILKTLAKHPKVELHAQNNVGDTALHTAVYCQKNECVAILLAAGSDPTLCNFNMCNPIQEAARVGFLPAVEQFVAQFPQHINLKNDNGYAAIHLAALNNHGDVVTLLAGQGSCDINAKTNDGDTPLHLAVCHGHCRVIERLVGYGADLNAVDGDGNTLLLVIISRQADMRLQSTVVPQIKKVQEELSKQFGGRRLKDFVVVACFLAQVGADVYIKNKHGLSLLAVCPVEIVGLITTFVQAHPSSFHGSLCDAYQSRMSELPQARMSELPQARVSEPPQARVSEPPQARVSQLPQARESEPAQARESEPEQARVRELPQARESEPEQARVRELPHPRVHLQTSHKFESAKDSKFNCSSTTSPPQKGSENIMMPTPPVPCFLCESPADVRFDPCGHCVMCRVCAKRAKRCPSCRVHIETKSELT